MSKKSIGLVWALATAGAVVAVMRHGHRAGSHDADGGAFVSNIRLYDKLTGLLLRSLFKGIADNITASVPEETRILEVGCGPGHLAVQLAQRGFATTGIDLDPAMIKRAKANSRTPDDPGMRQPAFRAGDVVRLPYPAATFDLVVSTLSMHHWADPTAGLAEIDRVLQADGRVLIWDLRPGTRHSPGSGPSEHTKESRLRVISSTPWRWPWRLKPLQRTELKAAPQETV